MELHPHLYIPMGMVPYQAIAHTNSNHPSLGLAAHGRMALTAGRQTGRQAGTPKPRSPERDPRGNRPDGDKQQGLADGLGSGHLGDGKWLGSGCGKEM